MNKLTHGYLLLVVVLLTAFRTDNGRVTKLKADSATLYVYRGGQFFAAGINYVIQVNGKDVCRLSNNKYIEYQVSPGKLTIAARRGGVELFKRETGVEIDAEAGKKYFVRGDVKSSITRTRLELSEVTENTAKRDMEKMTADNCQEALEKK